MICRRCNSKLDARCCCPNCGFDESLAFAYYPTLECVDGKLYPQSVFSCKLAGSPGRSTGSDACEVSVPGSGMEQSKAEAVSSTSQEEPPLSFKHHIYKFFDRRTSPASATQIASAPVSNRIVGIGAGDRYTVGVYANGTVIATGKNDSGQCNVSGWREIIAVSAGDQHIVGLRSDGTVIAVGDNKDGQCNVRDWKDIIAIAAGGNHTVGLRRNGTVVVTDKYHNIKGRGFVSVSTSFFTTISLRSDGTVVTGGLFRPKVSVWKHIIAVSAGDRHIVGLRSDGTAVAVSNGALRRTYDCCNVSGWNNLVAIAAGQDFTIGLRSDGTVVTTDNQYRIKSNDIIAIAAGSLHTVGLRANGTVVAAGFNLHGECDVSKW